MNATAAYYHEHNNATDALMLMLRLIFAADYATPDF